MWLSINKPRRATQGHPFVFGATILVALIASYVQSIPLTANQSPGLDVVLLPSDGGQYNGSDTHKRIEIGDLHLGGDPDTPSWIARQNTGRSSLTTARATVLWCLLNSKVARQSDFMSEEELERYGWDGEEFTGSAVEDEREFVAPVYNELGFNANNEGAWGEIHIKAWENSAGELTTPTLGNYQNIYNGPDGYIMACTNVSPREQGTGEPLPPLQKWSDVTALRWQSLTEGHQLKYVVRNTIANWNTRSAMFNALLAAGQATLPTWPGVDFTINEDGTNPLASAFWGLLGTYHGAGPAYMLAQHRNIFGHKTITRIRIWSGKDPWPISNDPIDLHNVVPHMLLYVDDVPNDA